MQWFKEKLQTWQTENQESIDNITIAYDTLRGVYPRAFKRNPENKAVSILRDRKAETQSETHTEEELYELMNKAPKQPDIVIDVVQASTDPKQATEMHKLADLWRHSDDLITPWRTYDLVGDPRDTIITMKIDNRLVGGAAFRVNKKDKYCELLAIGVARDYKKQGIGAYMLRSIENILIDNNINVIFGYVPLPITPWFHAFGYSHETNFITDWMAFACEGLYRISDWFDYERQRIDTQSMDIKPPPVMLEKHLNEASYQSCQANPQHRLQSYWREGEAYLHFRSASDSMPADYKRFGIFEDSTHPLAPDPLFARLREKLSRGGMFDRQVYDWWPEMARDAFEAAEDRIIDETLVEKREIAEEIRNFAATFQTPELMGQAANKMIDELNEHYPQDVLRNYEESIAAYQQRVATGQLTDKDAIRLARLEIDTEHQSYADQIHSYKVHLGLNLQDDIVDQIYAQTTLAPLSGMSTVDVDYAFKANNLNLPHTAASLTDRIHERNIRQANEMSRQDSWFYRVFGRDLREIEGFESYDNAGASSSIESSPSSQTSYNPAHDLDEIKKPERNPLYGEKQLISPKVFQLVTRSRDWDMDKMPHVYRQMIIRSERFDLDRTDRQIEKTNRDAAGTHGNPFERLSNVVSSIRQGNFTDTSSSRRTAANSSVPVFSTAGLPPVIFTTNSPSQNDGQPVIENRPDGGIRVAALADGTSLLPYATTQEQRDDGFALTFHPDTPKSMQITRDAAGRFHFPTLPELHIRQPGHPSEAHWLGSTSTQISPVVPAVPTPQGDLQAQQQARENMKQINAAAGNSANIGMQVLMELDQQERALRTAALHPPGENRGDDTTRFATDRELDGEFWHKVTQKDPTDSVWKRLTAPHRVDMSPALYQSLEDRLRGVYGDDIRDALQYLDPDVYNASGFFIRDGVTVGGFPHRALGDVTSQQVLDNMSLQGATNIGAASVGFGGVGSSGSPGMVGHAADPDAPNAVSIRPGYPPNIHPGQIVTLPNGNQVFPGEPGGAPTVAGIAHVPGQGLSPRDNIPLDSILPGTQTRQPAEEKPFLRGSLISFNDRHPSTFSGAATYFPQDVRNQQYAPSDPLHSQNVWTYDMMREREENIRNVMAQTGKDPQAFYDDLKSQFRQRVFREDAPPLTQDEINSMTQWKNPSIISQQLFYDLPNRLTIGNEFDTPSYDLFAERGFPFFNWTSKTDLLNKIRPEHRTLFAEPEEMAYQDAMRNRAIDEILRMRAENKMKKPKWTLGGLKALPNATDDIFVKSLKPPREHGVARREFLGLALGDDFPLEKPDMDLFTNPMFNPSFFVGKPEPNAEGKYDHMVELNANSRDAIDDLVLLRLDSALARLTDDPSQEPDLIANDTQKRWREMHKRQREAYGKFHQKWQQQLARHDVMAFRGERQHYKEQAVITQLDLPFSTNTHDADWLNPMLADDENDPMAYDLYNLRNPWYNASKGADSEHLVHPAYTPQ